MMKQILSWFRKNPCLMPDKESRRLLLPASSILQALGGEKWFENRKNTTKTAERSVKACRTCDAREPLVTLLRCNNCKHVYYCSKDCQRSNWKHHKVECREIVAEQEKVKRLSLTDPDGAKLATDWSLWRKQPQFDILVHALGLHRDPGRGRTHILFKAAEYAPTTTKLKYKFRVVSCGVFRIKDVLRDIELIMGLNRGEDQEYVDSLFDESAGTHAGVPYIELSFGDGLQAWLSSGE
ncbi:MYND-type domain-containing protein [Mycena sanguinolenta]|uniref:MYND-type domain-containing protein n=1 Tax=Mycena sanguinolenta TaxID=230812 RepID=A0A8H7CIB2_9AGAR|nr:MYND-type domain-containing protein [Mycena sanguinolenta]